MFLYFKFLERDGNRGLGLLPLYSLDWIGLDYVGWLVFKGTCKYRHNAKNLTCAQKMTPDPGRIPPPHSNLISSNVLRVFEFTNNPGIHLYVTV